MTRTNASPPDGDPYQVPAFSLKNRMARALWGLVYVFLFRPSPRIFFGWRNFLLRLFGAKIGSKCCIYSKAEIWAPWNLVCSEVVAVADGAVIYNPSLVTLGSHTIVSQHAYICGATHDPDDANFPLISKPVIIGSYSWVCARSTVMPGVVLGEGSVLALGAVATKNIEDWAIYGGVPAKKLRNRVRN